MTTTSTSPSRIDRRWLILFSIGIGSFMSALDGSIVNTILPVLRTTFDTNVATIEWVVTVYLLVVSGLLLTFGRLGDLYGHRKVYLSGFGLFIIGSALCGLSPTAGALVASRSLQGIGAAMIMSNAPALLTQSFPGTQRGRALGLQATMTYLGLTAGPALGGWLAAAFNWRAVYYINIPIGILALVFGYFFLPATQTKTTVERFDFIGALLFITGLVALLLGLNQGASWGWLSWPILGLIGAALAFLVVFVRYELRVTAPMLDLSLFRSRIFSAAAASAVLNYVALYCILFLLPFYLIQGRGLNSAQAGLILTAQPLVMAVAAPISGALSDRIGSRFLASLGMLILAGGLYLLSRAGADTPFYAIVISLAIAGLGNGIFISPNNSALMGAAPHQRQGIASGILATARNIGMVLGIGLAGAIMTSILAARHTSDVIPAVQTSLLISCGVALLSSLVASLRGQE